MTRFVIDAEIIDSHLQKIATPVRKTPFDLEFPGRQQNSGAPAGIYGVKMQPAIPLPGEHDAVVRTPKELIIRNHVVGRAARSRS